MNYATTPIVIVYNNAVARFRRTSGALIDAAVARRLGPAAETLPRWQSLAQRFATATRLEAAFWVQG